MKTFSAKPADVDQKWYQIDATGLTLGRLSTKVAEMLMGKLKPTNKIFKIQARKLSAN